MPVEDSDEYGNGVADEICVICCLDIFRQMRCI